MILIKLFMGALTTIGTIYGAIQGASAITIEDAYTMKEMLLLADQLNKGK